MLLIKFLSNLITISLILIFIIGVYSCEKDEASDKADYRDAFTGNYNCDVSERHSDILGNDTTYYRKEIVVVEKSGDSMLCLLGRTGHIDLNGKLFIQFDMGHGLLAKFSYNKIIIDALYGGLGFSISKKYTGTKE